MYDIKHLSDCHSQTNNRDENKRQNQYPISKFINLHSSTKTFDIGFFGITWIVPNRQGWSQWKKILCGIWHWRIGVYNKSFRQQVWIRGGFGTLPRKWNCRDSLILQTSSISLVIDNIFHNRSNGISIVSITNNATFYTRCGPLFTIEFFEIHIAKKNYQ